MPIMRRAGQQRVVPDRSVRAYQRRGWTSDDTPDTPSASDLKDVWVDYAVSRGVDRDEAEQSTKAELVERLGD